MTTILPEQLADGLAIGLDPAATLFAVAVSLLTVLAFGLTPALGATRVTLGLVLKGHSSQSPGNRGMGRIRTVLVTTQIALSMVLQVLAGLFAQSLANVARVNLGIDVDSLISFRVTPRLNGYSPERVMTLYDRLEEQLAAQPGVTSVSYSSSARVAVVNESFVRRFNLGDGSLGSRFSTPPTW